MNIAFDHASIRSELNALSQGYTPSPLLDLPQLAARLGIARLHAKDESQRPLGSFKSLGGTLASLRAAQRATLSNATPPSMLVCASDGNHGLAVASAGRHLGLRAIVYLHADVSAEREARIRNAGGETIRIHGTYDDCVDHARQAAQETPGALLIADTSEAVDDAVIHDIMTGYSIIAGEVRDQFAAMKCAKPTHLFIQAGVGGLAAAMAAGLEEWLEAPARVIVVEPALAACVEAGLAHGKPIRVPGTLETCATMLSCGEASAPALALLLKHAATAMAVSEDALEQAPDILRTTGGPPSTPSGCAGLAGLSEAVNTPSLRQRFGLGPNSRALLVVSEGL
ncbi:pyridoxal-phosphate dependent enzyme [Mesorhizobium sp. NBSH29]|uniref:pyridoxal-phosphate dependent enzyme n=1 Tax=Mesorhizobium sp. NBSH29 TaxID=2654249 RepID=UPI0021563834|nr:pyridoxal-phosphate dependent enzyme [Mesorhizobium sp. NBSH29]